MYPNYTYTVSQKSNPLSSWLELSQILSDFNNFLAMHTWDIYRIRFDQVIAKCLGGYFFDSQCIC